MKHTIFEQDKQHVIPTSLTDREIDILTKLSVYFNIKSRFCTTSIQKDYATEISIALSKATKL